MSSSCLPCSRIHSSRSSTPVSLLLIIVGLAFFTSVVRGTPIRQPHQPQQPQQPQQPSQDRLPHQQLLHHRQSRSYPRHPPLDVASHLAPPHQPNIDLKHLDTDEKGESASYTGWGGAHSVPSNHTLINGCSRKPVQMSPRRKIDAAGTGKGAQSNLLITSVSFDGQVWIQNAASKKYVCFNSRGNLKVKHSKDRERCIFEEVHNPHESTYMYMYVSRQDTGDFYLGFNKKGKKKKGHLPDKLNRQKCFKFHKSGSQRTFDTDKHNAFSYENGSDGRLPFELPTPTTTKPRKHRRRHDSNRDEHKRQRKSPKQASASVT